MLSIPYWVKECLGLSLKEAAIFSLIYAASQAEPMLFNGDLETLAWWVDETEEGALSIINSLAEKELILKKYNIFGAGYGINDEKIDAMIDLHRERRLRGEL